MPESNTFDISDIHWDYAFVGIGIQNNGGRINYFLIRNATENFCVFNIDSSKTRNIRITSRDGKLTIDGTVSNESSTGFYFLSIQFIKLI